MSVSSQMSVSSRWEQSCHLCGLIAAFHRRGSYSDQTRRIKTKREMDLIYGNGWTKWTLDVIAQSRCENDTGKCQYSFLWLMVVVSWDRNHDDKRETGGSWSESKEEYHEKKREIHFFSFLQKEKRIKKKTKWEIGGMGSGTKSINRMKRCMFLYEIPSGQENGSNFKLKAT